MHHTCGFVLSKITNKCCIIFRRNNSVYSLYYGNCSKLCFCIIKFIHYKVQEPLKVTIIIIENEDFENKEDRLAFNSYYPYKCSYKVVFLGEKVVCVELCPYILNTGEMRVNQLCGRSELQKVNSEFLPFDWCTVNEKANTSL